jgi:hypothetical protein
MFKKFEGQVFLWQIIDWLLLRPIQTYFIACFSFFDLLTGILTD